MADTEDGKRRKVDPEEAIDAMAQRGRVNAGSERGVFVSSDSFSSDEGYTQLKIDTTASASRDRADHKDNMDYSNKLVERMKAATKKARGY